MSRRTRRILAATPLALGVLSLLFTLGVGYYAAATNTTDGGLANVLRLGGLSGGLLTLIGGGIVACMADCGDW